MRTDPLAFYRVWCCGSFRVERRTGNAYTVIGTKEWGGHSSPRTMLKALICAPRRRKSRGTLLAQIWPEAEEEQATRDLNVAIYRLRKILTTAEGQECLTTEEQSSGFSLADQTRVWVDADAALLLLAEAERIGHGAPIEVPLLEEALSYFNRGAFLENDEGEWLASQRAMMERGRYRCQLWLAEAYAQQGKFGQAEALLTELLSDDPTDEDVICRLMALLQQRGLTHQALVFYQQTCDLFAREGLEISATTRAFAAQLPQERQAPALRVALPERKDPSSSSSLFSSLPVSQDIILGIPLILLNIPSSGYELGIVQSIQPQTLEAYEDVLVLSWETYYSSNSQRSARTVSNWQQLLTQQVGITRGVARDQLNALRCRFLQLGSVIARDRTDFATAEARINEALDQALHLQNSELTASALCRRARNYADQQQYQDAIKDLEAALPYADKSRDPLRCYISVYLAELYSLTGQHTAKSLKLLDSVERTVRAAHSPLENDGSFMKVDIPGLYMIRADVLRRAGRTEDAENALFIVQSKLPPSFTRWRGNLLVSQAQLAYADRDIQGACTLALDALDVIQATGSRSNQKKIEQLYTTLCANPRAAHSPSIKELGTKLTLGKEQSR